MIDDIIFFAFAFVRYVSINKHYMQWINDPVVTLLNGKVLDAGTSDVTVTIKLYSQHCQLRAGGSLRQTCVHNLHLHLLSD